MPELPDITLYLDALRNRISGKSLERLRLFSPFVLRSVIPPAAEAEGRRVVRGSAALAEWIDRLKQQTGDAFPDKVTTFHDEMAVHGRYKKSCPECGSPVQRIVYTENEANYCARCQTGGKLLADRALSRLLRQDWPKTLDELEGAGRRNRRDPWRYRGGAARAELGGVFDAQESPPPGTSSSSG